MNVLKVKTVSLETSKLSSDIELIPHFLFGWIVLGLLRSLFGSYVLPLRNPADQGDTQAQRSCAVVHHDASMAA